MGAISNGLALSGLIPFASTFLSFSDYLKPSIRLSALMNQFVIYIFTHDSITVGEDGPTHQPVEQLVSLRSIPNLDVYRPNDINEVIGAYKAMFKRRKASCLVASRNKTKLKNETQIKLVKKGGYILKETKDVDFVIISCGEELDLAVDIFDDLSSKGYNLRLVSMPSLNIFKEQSEEYQKDPGFGPLNIIVRPIFKLLLPRLRKKDLEAAARPDFYITISDFAKNEIKNKSYENKEAIPIDGIGIQLGFVFRFV